MPSHLAIPLLVVVAAIAFMVWYAVTEPVDAVVELRQFRRKTREWRRFSVRAGNAFAWDWLLPAIGDVHPDDPRYKCDEIYWEETGRGRWDVTCRYAQSLV